LKKKDIKALKKLLPVVEKYITHFFNQYEIENTSSLLDIVEAYDAKWVSDLFVKISDTLLVNIVQRQYKSFVSFLDMVKKRLSKAGSWDDFINGLKKKNKTKKKLMQMITMGGH